MSQDFVSRYEINRIPHHLADNFLKRHHYLAQQGNGFLGRVQYGLFTKQNEFVGVCVFAGISVIETLIGAFEGFQRDSCQDGFWELTRLAMDDEKKESNLTSWFVSNCIKRLRSEEYVRAIISYADSRYHHGYIYQATNFKYYGLTAQKSDFFESVSGGVLRRYGEVVRKVLKVSGFNVAESIDICSFTTNRSRSSGKNSHSQREITRSICCLHLNICR